MDRCFLVTKRVFNLLNDLQTGVIIYHLLLAFSTSTHQLPTCWIAVEGIGINLQMYMLKEKKVLKHFFQTEDLGLL